MKNQINPAPARSAPIRYAHAFAEFFDGSVGLSFYCCGGLPVEMI